MSTQQIKKIAVLIACLILFRFSLPFLWVFYLFCIPPFLIFLLIRYVIFPTPSSKQESVSHNPAEHPWLDNLQSILSSKSAPVISWGAVVARKTMIIAGVLLVTFLLTYLLCIDTLRAYRTHNGMSTLSSELSAYRNKTSGYPQTLDELAAGNPLKKSLAKDFWGNPITYTKEAGNRGFTLQSFGKDGIRDTPDDIILKKS